MYARMCVEVELNAPLLLSYMVDGNKLKIEYEGLHLICFTCGKFGHAAESCHYKKANEQFSEGGSKDNIAKTSSNKHGVVHGEQTDNIYSGWMLVQDARQGRRSTGRESKGQDGQKKNQGAGRQNSTSRFVVLAVKEEKNETDMTETYRVPLKEISNIDLKKDSGKKSLNQLKVGAGPTINDVNRKKKGKKGAVGGEKSKENGGEKEMGDIDRKVIGSGNRRQERGVQMRQEMSSEESKESEVVGQKGEISCGPTEGKGMLGGESIGEVKLGLIVGCGEAAKGTKGRVLGEQKLEKRMADCPESDMVLDQPEPPDLNEAEDYMGLSAVEKCMEVQDCMSEERIETSDGFEEEEVGN